MAALFARWTNIPYGIAIASLAAIVVAAVLAPMIYMRTPYGTAQLAPVVQPVDFDHRHHVRDDGIDCLYCHTGAETLATAGVPPTELCMGCHGQIAVAAVKALVVAVAFMELPRASIPARVVAIVTVVFIALLCAGTVADIAFR